MSEPAANKTRFDGVGMVLKKKQEKAHQDQLEEEACKAAVRLRGDGPERVSGSVSMRHAGLLEVPRAVPPVIVAGLVGVLRIVACRGER